MCAHWRGRRARSPLPCARPVGGRPPIARANGPSTLVGRLGHYPRAGTTKTPTHLRPPSLRTSKLPSAVQLWLEPPRAAVPVPPRRNHRVWAGAPTCGARRTRSDVLLSSHAVRRLNKTVKRYVLMYIYVYILFHIYMFIYILVRLCGPQLYKYY